MNYELYHYVWKAPEARGRGGWVIDTALESPPALIGCFSFRRGGFQQMASGALGGAGGTWSFSQRISLCLVYYGQDIVPVSANMTVIFIRVTYWTFKCHSFGPANSGLPMKCNLGAFLEMYMAEIPEQDIKPQLLPMVSMVHDSLQPFWC